MLNVLAHCTPAIVSGLAIYGMIYWDRQVKQQQRQQRQPTTTNDNQRQLNRQDKIPKPQLKRKEIKDNSNELSWEITEQAFD